jgi:hypothetical protein
MVQAAGSHDPAAGVGVGFRFSSLSPFSGGARPAPGRAAQPGRRHGPDEPALFPAIGYTSLSQHPGANVRSLTLPAIAIAFPLFSVYTRLLRADIVEQMQREDHIVTARAKGVRSPRPAPADPPARAPAESEHKFGALHLCRRANCGSF